MRFNEAFPHSKRYIKGADLADGEKIVGEISHVESRVIGRDAGEAKPVLVFKNDCSPLVLNTTQWQTLEKSFGDDSRDWAGQAIELRGKDGVTRDGKAYRTVEITCLPSVPQEERQAAVEAAREAEAERQEAEAAAEAERKAKRPKLAGAKNDLNDEIPF
jgi:hypothetical protein